MHTGRTEKANGKRRPLLILASQSARRVRLLSALGMPFRVMHIRFRERFPSLPPEEAARMLAWRKAETARRHVSHGVILTGDTIVSLDGTLFGKPHDRREAAHMLEQLAGRTHEVVTALVLMDAYTRCAIVGSERSLVTMRRVAPRDIRKYVGTGEPLDKAGAYGIQGMGGKLVTRVRGDWHNVVGFPLGLFATLAARFGIRVPRTRLRKLLATRSA